MAGTAPDSNYTHWKHTVFYIDEAITVSQGSYLNGSFACRPNTNNKVSRAVPIVFSPSSDTACADALLQRDLDFEIEVDYQGEHEEFTEKFSYKMR